MVAEGSKATGAFKLAEAGMTAQDKLRISETKNTLNMIGVAVD